MKGTRVTGHELQESELLCFGSRDDPEQIIDEDPSLAVGTGNTADSSVSGPTGTRSPSGQRANHETAFLPTSVTATGRGGQRQSIYCNLFIIRSVPINKFFKIPT